MILTSLVLSFLLQAPAPAPASVVKNSVVVGLLDGQQIAIDDPQFTGFIESRDGSEPVLLYRQKQFRGELKLSTVQRIDFTYTRDRTYELGVTLKNGQKLTVESDRRDFVIIKGSTDTGSVLIKHPDPISPIVRISTKRPDRAKDLRIQYLEFPR